MASQRRGEQRGNSHDAVRGPDRHSESNGLSEHQSENKMMNPQSITWDSATLMAEDLQREAANGRKPEHEMATRQPSEWWLGLRAVMNGLWVMSGLLATVALQNQIGFATLALVTGVIAAPVVAAAATK
jgi:hypothetical protein